MTMTTNSAAALPKSGKRSRGSKKTSKSTTKTTPTTTVTTEDLAVKATVTTPPVGAPAPAPEPEQPRRPSTRLPGLLEAPGIGTEVSPADTRWQTHRGRVISAANHRGHVKVAWMGGKVRWQTLEGLMLTPQPEAVQ